MESAVLTIGFIINPLAGLGGALALKGSDQMAPADLLSPDTLSRSMARAKRAMAPLQACAGDIAILCWGRGMGSSVLASLDLPGELLGDYPGEYSTGEDSKQAARHMVDAGADIVVFVGGDGTARDIYDALGDSFPVLGIPAGVKMHSGVFAVSPEAAGELLVTLVRGGLVGLALQEVRDIDEQAFRKDIVRSRFYGEMLVPSQGRYLQHTKVGGVENADLVAVDIAAWVVESMDKKCTYIIGPGSTTAAIMAELGLANTLLGVDVVRGGQLLRSDANEQTLLALAALQADNGDRAAIIVTVIGGQGHVFGRGNQQISAAVIRAVGERNIQIVAAKSKITALAGRPLLLDTNDPDLDMELSGYRPIITGYADEILYRLAVCIAGE